MERISRRETAHLGYSPHRSFPTNSDVNFSDVFGGPPRRSLMYEVRRRYSSAQTNDSDAFRVGVGVDDDDDEDDDDEASLPYRGSWTGVREKPVFGEDLANRRRNKGGDFFNDIFGGHESSIQTPRKQRLDPFASAPGSADQSGISVPYSQISPPSKVLDLPTFGSSKSKDQAYDVKSYSFSRSTSLSRFSSQSTTQGQEEPKNDIHMFSRQSSSSREVSLSSEELSSAAKSEKPDRGSHSINGLNSSEVLSDGRQFHFSMYKWASKGLPSMMRGKGRLKEMGGAGILSSSEEPMSTENVSSAADKPSFGSMKANAKSFGMDDNRMENDSLRSTITQSRAELSQMVGEKIISLPEFVTVSRVQNYVEYVPKDTVLEKSKEEMKMDSHSEVGLSGKAEKGTPHPAVVHEAFKSNDPKPLRSLLNDNSNEQGNDEINVKSGGNKVENRSNKKASVEKIQTGKMVRKQEEKRSALTGTKVDKASVKASLRNSGSNLGDEYLKPSENRYSATKTENYTSSDTSKLMNTSVSSTASVPDVSKTVVGDTNERFERAFVMKELPLEKNEKPQPVKDQEDMQNSFQVFDAKIQKWSNGKEGNIRSLLSTLQYVLWAESGWKPVPLVNIIEGTAVKRVYQRALLCVHPDKLQQKGAALHQKYIAEKVFDILQEAWTQFSSLAPL